MSFGALHGEKNGVGWGDAVCDGYTHSWQQLGRELLPPSANEEKIQVISGHTDPPAAAHHHVYIM